MYKQLGKKRHFLVWVGLTDSPPLKTIFLVFFLFLLFEPFPLYKICSFTLSKKFRSSNEELVIECHHGQGVLLCGSNLTIQNEFFFKPFFWQFVCFTYYSSWGRRGSKYQSHWTAEVIVSTWSHSVKKRKKVKVVISASSPRPKTIFLGETAQLPIRSQNGIGENYLRQLRMMEKKLNYPKSAR